MSNISVSDALANLSKAATVALNVVHGAQEHTQEELTRLRDERDDALKALQEAQLDAKDMEVREGGWKAAIDKSNLTIKHQAETITQLRAEVQQWKTQLDRTEESSRQEVDGWKDQYRRAEHERARLSARIEELVAGQLAWNAAAHAYTAPFTPRLAYANLEEPAASSSATKRASTSHSHRAGTPHASRAPAEDESGPSTAARKSRAPHSKRGVARAESWSRNASPTRQRRKENASGAESQAASGKRTTPRTPAAARAAPSQSQPRQQVVRRVTAIVDVKEEEDTDYALNGADSDSAASGSVYDPDDAPPTPPGGRRRRAPARQKRSAQQYDEEEQTAYEDDDDDGAAENEAEDDELLLGPKTKKPPRGPVGETVNSHAGARGKQLGPAKKRKLDTGGTTVSGQAKKAAKTR